MFRTRPADFRGPGGMYDPPLACATAEHAIAVYQHPGDYAARAAMDADFDGATILERGPAQVGIAWTDELIVISPRGSSQMLDWLVDAASVVRVGWDPYLPPGVRVGWGFRRQAERILEPLVEFVAHLRQTRPRAKIVSGAHSLGAAVLPLLVAALRHIEAGDQRPFVAGRHELSPEVVYLHCCPRIGNKAWADWYRTKIASKGAPTFSVVNILRGEPDLVTRIPKKRWGFRHIGTRVLLRENEIYFGDAAWRSHRAKNPVGFWRAARIITRSIRSIRAHSGRKLVKRLRRNRVAHLEREGKD